MVFLCIFRDDGPWKLVIWHSDFVLGFWRFEIFLQHKLGILVSNNFLVMVSYSTGLLVFSGTSVFTFLPYLVLALENHISFYILPKI